VKAPRRRTLLMAGAASLAALSLTACNSGDTSSTPSGSFPTKVGGTSNPSTQTPGTPNSTSTSTSSQTPTDTTSPSPTEILPTSDNPDDTGPAGSGGTLAPDSTKGP
jgi:hypothetical protein